jgi:hypothetical protein
MAINTATQAQVRAAWKTNLLVTQMLQQYVQGNANGTKGTKGRFTDAEITAALTAANAANTAVLGA